MRIHISILTFLALCLMLFTGPFVSFGQGNNLSPVRESLTVVFHEGFDDAVFPPPLWTVTDFGLSDYGWEHATWTFHIGGGSAYGNWDLDEINTWLISPPIVLEPDLQYHLEFFQRNYNFGTGGNSVVMVSTGSNQAGSSDFVEVYQMNEAFPVFTETSINLSGFSGNEIYLAFVHHGTNAHEWVIDEVTVREIANADAGIIGLISPTALIEPGNYEVIVEMENFGSVIITSLDIVCEIDDFVETFTWDGALYPGESTHVSIISSFDFSSSGLHSITVTTLLEDDGNPENDSFSTEVISGESCGYTVYMTSLTGNGFHGASIGFIQSGVITASFGAQFTEGSAFGPLNLVIADGYPTELIALTAGDFSSSLGFTVIDPQGDTIHHRSFGSAFSAGDLFEFFQSDCNLLEYDAGIYTFSMEELYVGEEISAIAQVKNYGNNAANFNVKLEIRNADNAVVETQDVYMGNLETGMMETLVFEPFTLVPGNYSAVVSIVWDLDGNSANDQMFRSFDAFDGILAHYDDGVKNDLIGWSVPVWDAAILFEPAERFVYGEGKITHLRLYVGQAPTNMEVKIWQGPGAETEIYSQAFEPIPFSWNIVALDLPQSIDTVEDLYVGVRIYGAPFVMALGVDAQLNHPNYGNLFRPDGIGPWYQSGEEDWNLQFVFLPGENLNMVTFVVNDADNNPVDGAVVSLEGYGSQTTVNGYALFQDIQTTPYPGIPYLISAEGYFDIDGNVIVEDNTTVEVTMLLVGIRAGQSNTIAIYPNPSRGIIQIKADNEKVQAVHIINQNGTPVLISTASALDVSALPKGLYFLRVFTDKGTYHERLIVQ